MHRISGILLFIIATSFSNLKAQQNDLVEALKLLNEIRANPSRFDGVIGIPLGDISQKGPLKWNQTLAIVAQRKAQDMANRNYFNHVDPEGYGINYFIQKAGYTLPKEWTDNIANNFCESLAAGSSNPKEGIIQLINDGGVREHNQAGHRVHLLGISDFFSKAYDIGIGWASNPNSSYKNYLVVITARHEW